VSGDQPVIRHRAPSNRRHLLRVMAKVLGAAVSVTLFVAFGYGWFEYRSLNSGLHRLHLANLGKPVGPSTPGQQVTGGQAENILVVGIDSRDGLSRREQRLLSVGHADTLSADTIMIIHVPADGSRATMISIPRDSFVDIPGYLKNKINAAYADGYTFAPADSTAYQRRAAGADLLIATVSKLTGLRIDHYVQIGFGGFYTIAKAIGGITVNLCASTDDTHVHNRAEGNGWVGSDFKMSAGRHTLTPVQALEFVRQRHNLKGGDLAREKRQRYFLSAAFDKITSAGVLLDPSKLNRLIKAVDDAIYVDDAGFSLLDLAKQMADLSANHITGYTIPTDGPGSETVAGVSESVVEVNPAQVRSFVRTHLDGAPTHRPGHHRATQPRPPTKGCIY
jgi:LCP family protein required for cell wall assembly